MTATTPAMSAMACAICTNISGNRSHAAREMMFGWRDSFTYLECAACGCLQNVSVPRDLGRYYGTDYYSVAPHRPRRRLFYDAIKATRTRAHLQGLQGSGIIGRNLLKRFGPPGLPKWVARCGLRQDSNILEVGCGSGALLLSMRSEGFTRLAGADPFIESDIDHGCGLVVRRAHIADLVGELRGAHDLVVLEHAFEHIPEQQVALRGLAALLAPGGWLVISMPVLGYAWQHYGVDWVQLDAPRHLFLHTEASFARLAGDAGLTVVNVVHDSGAVQFWGSEQYRRDIPLLDARSHRVNPARSGFTAEIIAGYERQAAVLNTERRGDQATFYLRS